MEKKYQLRGEGGEYFQDSRTKEMANLVLKLIAFTKVRKADQRQDF